MQESQSKDQKIEFKPHSQRSFDYCHLTKHLKMVKYHEPTASSLLLILILATSLTLAIPQPLADDVTTTTPVAIPSATSMNIQQTADAAAPLKPIPQGIEAGDSSFPFPPPLPPKEHIVLPPFEAFLDPPEPPATYTYNNATYEYFDINKELIDYDDVYMDSLRFILTERQALATSQNKEEAKKTAYSNLLLKHHNYQEMHQYLLELTQKCPSITKLYSIGKSVEGRNLWVLEISENPGKHQLMKPEFKYVANMHGNEVVGRELLLHLARLLCENYVASREEQELKSTKPSGLKFVKKLLEQTRIHLMPSMNPDGYEKAEVGCVYEKPSKRGRLNANNVDLNRNFPDLFRRNKQDSSTQPEVRAVMAWSKSIPFVLSANLHGGALVASFGYDGNVNGTDSPGFNGTPDNEVFNFLANRYAQSHPYMTNNQMCYDECTKYHLEIFENGITNGANWYPLYGGMQDWMYEHTNDFEITVEVGCNQYPPANTLGQYWFFNKRSLLNYMKSVHLGIKGTIKDEVTGTLLSEVNVHVLKKLHNVTSTQYGDYFRILMPGNYEILFEKEGYKSQSMSVFVDSTMASIFHVALKRSESYKPQHKDDSTTTTTTEKTPQDEVEQEGKTNQHSLVVATLVMTIITVLILIAMAGAYVIQKRRFRRSQSMTIEMQPTRPQQGSASTGISLAGSGSAAKQSASNLNLAP